MIHVSVLASPITIDNKQVGTYGIYRNITKRKLAEAALRKAHEELERRVEERTTNLAKANRALQAEIAERKKAEDQKERQAVQALLIYKVGQKVSSKLEPEALLSEIVTTVYNTFNYYGVMLMLLDEEEDLLVLTSIAGGYADVFPDDLCLKVGEGMIGHAAKTKKTQVSGDVTKNPYYVRKAKEVTLSELSVPIISGNKAFGVLDIQSDKLNDFDKSDVTAMETLSTQIAIAIENANLYGQAHSEIAERERLIHKLRDALKKIRTLSGLLPICAACKKIRDDKGYWNQIESYIGEHSDAEFSHSICPECAKELYPDIDVYD